MPNPLDTLYDQLKGQYPDLVDRSEFIGKLSNEEELKKLHDAASKDIPGFVDFDNFKSKVGESLSTYDQDSDYKAQSASTEQESAPTDITIPRREKSRHVPSKPQNGGIVSEAYVPTQPGQPTDTRVDAEAFDRETGDLDELDRRYQEKIKRLEGYGAEQNLYANEDEARKHYEAYSKLYDEAEQDRLVYNRRVKAAEDERAEQQRQLDLQSKDRKTRRTAEYGGYTNDQVRKEQERLKKERAYLEDPKSRRNADYSKRVMEYNADQTALSGEADKRNKRAESKRAMYNEVKKVAEDPDVQKRITGNDTVTYVLSGNNPYALQNYDAARERAKTMTDEELVDACKTIAGQKYARGDNKDIYAPLASSFMAYHNELMYRLGGDEPKSALEMRYDMIDKVTESSHEGDEFMTTLRNYLDGTAGMGTQNYETDTRERANIPQFAVVDYFNSLLAQKEAENKENVERIAHSPDADDFKGMEMARAVLDINYDAMLQQAFDQFGEENLKAYITAYALRNGISVDEAARRVNQSIWDETIGKEMEESRPKSNAEFFLRRITSDNMFAKLWQIGLRAQNGTLGSTDAFMVNSTVLDEYAKDHPGWDTAAVVTNFAVMEGPIFTAYGKLAGGLVGAGERAIIGAATKTAEKTAIESTVKALNQSFWYRLAKGVPTGGLVGFQYGTMSGAIDQAYYDGNVNFGKVIANGLHMGRDFAIMHGVGEVFGVTGDAILRRGQRAFRNGQGKFINRLETASLDFLNNVAKTTTNAAVVTGLYAAIDKPALERENKKIAAENARLPEDQRKPLNQIASVEDTFYSSLRMFAGLDAVGTLRRAWSIGVRGDYERNKHVKIHFDKFDREALEKAFGKNPNSLLRQIVFGNVDGIPAKWFEIDPEAEREIYKELGRELTPAEKEAYATYGFTELRKVILNKDIPWATRAKIVSVITGRVVQEPPVAKGDFKAEMDSSGTQIKRIIVKSLDLEGNDIQITEFSGKEFEAARRLYESLNDRGWRNNAMLCGNLVIDAIKDKTYADTVDEMAREKGIAPEQFEQMVFGIKQKDITGEKVTDQERQLVDEFDKRHQEKQKAETELSGPSKLFEQIAREVFGAEWKQAKAIPYKSWGEMTEAEKEFVNRYIDRMGAMGVAERNKLMNANPDWVRTAKEYEESVRRRMEEAERPAEAEPLPALEDEKVSVETPVEERVEPTPEVIELEEEKPAEPEPTADNGDAATELSPEMKIVQEAKSRFPGENRIVLLRFGDHYEVYNEDAERVHEVMGDEFPITERNGEGGINKVVEFKPEQLDKVLPTMIRTGVSSMIREVPVTETAQKPVAEEKPDTEGQLQAGTIGFEPVEQPTERERFDAERKEKAATITDADIEANREALGIPEGTALTDEARQIYAEDLAEDLMRYERFKRGESDEKARFHDYWESKFNPKRPKLEKPVEKQEEPVEEEEVTEADALIEQFDNLKGRSDLEKYRNALTVFAGDAEIMGILEDLEPRDITEWVSSFLGLDSGKGYSMLWESKTRGGTVIAKGFKEETGWSWNDAKGFAFMFDNKNGMSPRRVAEKIWENLPSGMKDQYSDVDVFNIMMDLFKSSSRKSDLTNYIRNNRMEQVRDLLNRRRSEELDEIARNKERIRQGEEQPVAEPATPDESANEFVAHEDDIAPFSLLSLNYRQGEVEGGTVRSRARTRKQIGTIAKALGYKIRWVADKSYNAKIDTDEKVLYLNIRTDQPLAAVMGHEVTHDLRKSDPKAYETLKRYAKDLLGQEQWDNEVKDVTDVYNEEYKRRGWEPIRADKSEEEVVCDTMGKLLHSRNGLRELAGSLDPGVAGKVYRLMKDITEKVKTALGKEHDYSTMDSALQEFLKSVEQRAKKGDIATIQNTPAEGEATIDLSLRRKPAPKKVRKVYKLMRLKMSEDGKTLGEDGKVYPLYIDSGTGLDMKNWYDADSPAFDNLRELDKGYWLYDLATGETEKADKPSKEQIAEADAQGKRYMVIRDVYDDVYDKYNKDKENWEASQRGEKKWKKKKPFTPLTPEQLEKKAIKAQKDAEKRYSDTRRYYNIGLNGSGDVGEYALRPGWHAGSHPTMRQIGKGKNKNLRDDTFVWVEGYVPDDVEYQTEAEGNIDKDIPTHIPTDGHYLMLTNPNAKAAQADRVGWYVAGAFRPERILSDWEARQVIDEWNAEHPNDKIEYDFERESGRVFNAETMQLEEPGSSFSLKRDGRDEDKAPTFYSNAAKAVENVKQNKATAEQWKAMLTKQGGIKAGEDKWMGLSQWLDEHKGQTLTKEEVAQFVAENQVQVADANYAELDYWDRRPDGVYENPSFDYEIRPVENVDRIHDTRLQFTTKGLKNNREIALVVPTIEPYNESDKVHFGDAGGGRAVAWVRFGDANAYEGGNTDNNLNTYREIDELERRVNDLEESLSRNVFGARRKRLEEDLAKAEEQLIELYSRKYAGKRYKVLVIDEIQSKRHQDAREKGYQSKEWVEKENRLEELFQKRDRGEEFTADEQSEFSQLKRWLGDPSRENEREAEAYKVPAAPFEKNWHELAMKRMLRYAAENGYDKIAWTTGMQQASRYNIGKVIGQISRTQTFNTGETRFDLMPKDNSGSISLFVKDGIVTRSARDEFAGMPLTDVVGKEVAQKMLEMPNHSNFDIADMDIGGEGMKGFYDDMLPRFMDKYGKKWGVKTGTVELDLPNEGDWVMHSVDVTPEMKESVMQGQPLFSLKRDKERTLMGVHNITAEKLRSALKLGGLANPSMAVIDTKVGGFDNFGEISLIPASDLIASRTGRNAGTWGADAYSPRFPETHRRLGKGGDKKMRSWIKGLGMRKEMEFNTEEQFNDYYNSFNIRDNALVYPFLHEKGLSGEVDYYTHMNVDQRLEDDLREANGDQFVLLKRFDEDEEYKKKLTDIVIGDEIGKIRKKEGETFQQFRDRRREWAKEIREGLTEEDGFINRNLAEDLLYAQARAYRENGKFNESYTHTNAEKYIRDHGMQDEYQQYFEQKMQELGAETQVYAGSDSMGRSKFKPIDLESVSKQMKKQGRAGGEGGIFEDSPGAIRAKLLNPMKTLDQIRKEKGRIVSHDEFEQAREEYQDRLRDYADTYANGSIGALADILTSRDMAETARRYNKDLDAGDLYDLNEFKDYIKKLPTEYFETKFERPVGLDEFKKAVVPDNLPLDLYGALERAGLEIVEYPAGDREERQRKTLEAVKDDQDVMFSLKRKTYTDANGNEVYTETREDGTKDREITTYGDGSKKALWYDDAGVLKERLDYYPNGEVSQVANYDYAGELTRHIQYDENRRITSYYLPAIGTDWKLDENGIARGKSNGVEITPYNFQFSLKTYHGSAADFDKFDHNFMGSGEGNQAFGWGTYVTTDKGTGRHYAEFISAKRQKDAFVAGDKRILEDNSDRFLVSLRDAYGFSNNPIFKNVGDIRAWVDKTVEKLQNNISACEDRLDKIESGEVQDYNGQLYDSNYQHITMYERKIDMLQRGLEEHFGGMDDSTPVSIETEKPNRYLYKVDIPDDTGENYLDYAEKPTDEFKKKVEDALYNDWHQKFQDNIKKGRYSAEGFDSLEDFIKFKEKSYRDMLHKDLADADKFWKVYDYIAEGQTAEAYKYASNFLSKLGYTGIKVPTGYTTGGNGKGMNYIVFNENDLKITNKEQFSLKREDAEYQKAAESKYMWRSAARMLKKAAKAAMPDTKIVDENGDPLEVWHGSDTEFFVFDRDKIGTHSDEGYTGKGFYFAPRFEHADHYNRAKDGVTRKFYLNVTNPLIVTGQNANDSLIFGYDTLEEAKKKIWKYRAFFDGGEAGAQKYIDELTQEKLDEINSHDGVWRQGTMDNGYYDEIVVKDSKQVKSADVALYDDNGNFIPLSERFNLENEDTRFSLKRRRNRDDYTDEDRADAAIIANTYLAQADALRQQIEADRQREHQLVEERNKLLAFDYPAADPADRPAIMDRINALRNQINDLRNANYENNTKLRSMDYEYRVAKEILEQGAVTDEEAARFDAGQMTREEKVLESLFKAAADSRADKKAKQKAIRGLVRELTAITDNFKAAMKARGIESQRKHYDKGTVDHIIRLAKAMMGTGYIDNMTSYEVKRLMGMINNAATRESIEEQAGRIVDMMLDHQIRTLRNDFDKQLRVTGQKTNSSGVQVQAGLDQEGQVVMEAMRKSMQIIADSAGERYDSNGNITEWGGFYEKTLNDMGDADPVKAEQARKIFEGVWLASKWYEDVRTMEINGRILRSQMEDFKASNKPAKDADADTKQRYNDVLADYQEMLRQNKIKIIEAYERMTGDVGLTQAESVRRAKEFADAQKQRVNEIQHNANSDLADVDDNTQVETPESRVFGANKNNVLARLLFASAGTYEKFMRFFGRMAPNGEGYLFKRFMTQYHHARQDYWKGRHSAFEEMDKKMAEVFGKKKMHWSDIYEMTRDHKKFPPITVSYWDGYRNGQPYLRVDELNQSEALYLYMINKMPDGRMKLRHMGITDDVVQQMAGQINNKLIQLADWLQSEFLPKMRIKYNETHKRVFGADMAAIEDYFPLRINKLAVASDMDITERDMNDNKPSTITGAIVKRRVNTLPIDLHTDAFDVALSHIDEMEHWSAFAEFNRDNNTLVNYKRFRTKVNNMRSLELGAGNVLWKNFTDAVAIAADAYHPRAGSRSGDHYSTRVAKFVSTAKIALRPYTALKQLLSIPAFWADSDPLEQMKATVNVADTWQWAIENLPGFAERWQSRQAGNIKLANYNDLSGLRRRKTMRKLQRAGMWANAAIDGLACAMGGKAVYETKLKRYRKMGYDEARAQEKALIDAAIAYNNSQQSSEGAYVSPLQVDRTWFANAFSVFRSASMGYTRRMNTSLRQLRNATFKPGYGAQSVEFLKKQMMRDGLTEEQATKWAHRIYRRANLKAAASVAIFGQILPFAWNLGANMFYLLFGDDDKEKEGILADSFRHSFFGPVEGLTGGNVISELGDIAADTAIGNIWGDGIWGDSEAYKMLGYRDFSTMPLSSDLRNLLKYFARDEVKAANEVVNILFQVATGVNPQTITDWTTAILDFSRSDMERRDIAMFAMRLLSTPQQQLDKFYLDQMNLSQEQASKMSVDDLIKRYATYKRWRETPLTGWMYSDEREKEVEEKFQNRYEQMLEERSVAEDGLRGTINEIKDLPRKRTMMQKLQKELTDSIEAADPELYKKALEGEKADDDEYVRHVTDKDVEQMAELQMKKKALRAARDRKVKADKDAEAGRITQEEYDAIYEVCAHEWKLYNYLNNTLPKKLKEWKLKMEPDMQDKYTPEQVMDTIRSKTDKALQMRPEDMKLKKGDKKKVKKNKKK